MKKYFGLLAAAAMFTACENTVELDAPSPTAGNADFSNYVAIGNSLTAGYADGGVYAESQSLSFPSMIAMKMEEATPGMNPFTQPTISGNGSGYRALVIQDGELAVGGVPEEDNWFAKVGGFPFGNMGVPGIRTIDISVESYGNTPSPDLGGNPYFYRMLPEGATNVTYAQAVVGTDPTFFTCWLGNNDVLGYATSGGAAGVNGAPGTFLNGLSPVAAFQASYEGLIAGLTADGTTKGVVATIPNVTAIPYFTTVPAKVLPLDAATVAALNAGYAQFNAAVTGWNAVVPAELQRETITFTEGQNYPVIVDEALSDTAIPDGQGGVINLPKIRQLHEGELLLLTTPTSEFLNGMGTATPNGPYPVPSQYTLTESELANIASYTNQFNTIIRNVASSNPNVALWDAAASFDAFVAARAYSQHGVTITPTYISGGAFSLDGVHATPRGYAWAANNFINAINTAFGANLGILSIGEYRGVKFP